MKVKATISVPKWIIPFIFVAYVTKSTVLDEWCNNRVKNRIKYHYEE